MLLEHRYSGQLITKVNEYDAHPSLRNGIRATRFRQLGSSIRTQFPANLLGGDRGGIRTHDGHSENDAGVQTRLASTTRHHPTTLRYFIALDVTKRVSVRLGRFWTFSYEKFLIMQAKIMAVFNTMELLTDDVERKALTAGLADLKAGRVRTLDEIEMELERR